MLDSFKERDFTDCGGRYAIVLFFKTNFFERDELPSDEVFTLVNHAVSTLAELLQSLVALKLLGVVAELLGVARVR